MTAFFNDLDKFGDRPALIDETGTVVCYDALLRCADSFAAELGSTPQVVLLAMDNSIDAVVAYLGALRGRHPVILTADAAAAERLAPLFEPQVIAHGTQIVTRSDRSAPTPHPDLAVLLSTSGSTGSAKLVRLSAVAVDANARSIVDYLEINETERAITTLQPSYSYGLSVLNSHLAAGASLVLTTRSVTDPQFWNLVNLHAATSLAGVPYIYELLESIRFRDMNLPTLRTLTQAGGRLADTLLLTYADWGRTRGRCFVTMYGQTEATARIAWLAPADLPRLVGCIGRAIPGGTLALRPVEGQPNGTGELIYAGPNVMMGYAMCAADLARGNDLSELATGDLAEEVEPGVYRIVGRLRRFAKIAGLRVGFDDIEALLANAGVAAQVTGDDSGVAIALLSADVVTRAQVEKLIAERTTIPRGTVAIVAVAEWPRLPSGKIDYAALTELGRQERSERAVQARTDAGASPIAAAFAPLLRGRAAAPDDSFTSLAGDSLSYVQVSMAIQEALGTLPLGWENLTLTEIERLQLNADKRSSFFTASIIDSEIVIRVLAIVAVVIGHASDLPVGGGAYVLLLLFGLNLARFRLIPLSSGRSGELLSSTILQIMLPYYVILSIYLIYKHELNWPAILFVGNFVGQFHTFIEPYWFLEALLQCSILVSILFRFSAVKLYATSKPFELGVYFLAGSLSLKLLAIALFNHVELAGRTPDSVLYLVALGWCLNFAHSNAKKYFVLAITIAISLVPFFGYYGEGRPTGLSSVNITHAVWIITTVTVLLWIPRIAVSHVLRLPLVRIATSSFSIYLLHGIVVYLSLQVFHFAFLPLILAGSLVIGIAGDPLVRRTGLWGDTIWKAMKSYGHRIG